MNNDYRLTNYYPNFNNVINKKKVLYKKIRSKSKARNLYPIIQNKYGEYFTDFYDLYNWKCSYCGVSCKVVSVDLFNIDHYYPESKLTNINDKSLNNYVLSCDACNKNKDNLVIDKSIINDIHPDVNINNYFTRNANYGIEISENYRDNKFVNIMYTQLKLDGQLHRIDYLVMQIDGLANHLSQKEDPQSAQVKSVLNEAYIILIQKRNLFKRGYQVKKSNEEDN